MIVDAHTHVLSDDTSRYPRRSDPGHWFHGAGDVDALLRAMDGAGVDAAVLVQFVGGYGYDCRYAADAATRHPDRLAMVGAIDMEGPDPAAALRALAAATPATAVRLFGVGSETATAHWLHDGRADAVWEAAAESRTGVVATIWGRDLHHLRPLAEARPELPVAVDHCGFLDLAGGDEAVAPLLALADLPAVHVKVSSHVLAPLEEPAAAVALLVEAFGAERVAWGSDYPQSEGSYATMVALARRAVAGLAPEQQGAVLGGTAQRLWFRG